MDQDEGPKSRPRTSKTTAATAGPTEEELSRIAREAVRQPADPRLDRELERMGLGASAPLEPHATHHAGPQARTATIGPEVEKLQSDVRRLERMVWALVIVAVVLAVAVGYLLVR